jgi:hypothetical protein
MDWNQIVFLVWCTGIHCLLWAMMDANTRLACLFLYNRIKYRFCEPDI